MADLEGPGLEALLGTGPAARLREDVRLLDGVGSELDMDQFARGRQTPVFFGSALTNFGVELFLKRFIELAPPPSLPDPTADFAGFVFKIQSNMNPLHRDSMAFVRVLRGALVRDLQVQHVPSGRRIRLGQAHTLFARERETLEVAVAGDVVGVANPGYFAIGDMLTLGTPPPPVVLPSFQPEHFAVLRHGDVQRQKAFLRGLEQLEQEGAVQILQAERSARREPVLAAVGRLQFDVVQFRLRSEYGVTTELDVLPYSVARWLGGPVEKVDAFRPWGVMRCTDRLGRPLALFPNEREVDYHVGEHPDLRFVELGAADTLGVGAPAS